MTKPSYLLLYSGGLASTTTMLKSIRENMTPLLFFYKNVGGPAGSGEHYAVHTFARKYGLETQYATYAAAPGHKLSEKEVTLMLEHACQAAAAGSLSVFMGRKVFMGAELPPSVRLLVAGLYVPQAEHSDEDYRAALDYEPTLFRDTFSCTESFNLVPCGKCTKCKEKAALYSRIRKI